MTNALPIPLAPHSLPIVSNIIGALESVDEDAVSPPNTP